ncbi:DNA polymerase III subunit psi [Actinobacillus succinogenes]|uniref:DNA polymerase III subunit psi n=1 Tax=Actinobacillus succinogenes (strain ATCC 55618 / DSM 22257 / CCUG 43843 / 130Z) TaxID=339671 RepID=A6VMV3_ACTSZ|nr:DNA polymerase III subunit psi [Actinobacillus succinogenes]ABR74300.1 DNA polymerase III psi subunit [Actinobacillus succinogenes 130Z]PHI39275.1 DNA polymerase III subunit psi [Actinobacillus succinogenes]
MNKRDFILCEMGIIQWELVRPDVLKGAVNIPISENIRLIVISDNLPERQNCLLQDILRSVELNQSECLFTDFAHISHLNIRHPLKYWVLTENQEKIDRTLPLCKQAEKIWQSADLTRLSADGKLKRALWKQICKL